MASSTAADFSILSTVVRLEKHMACLLTSIVDLTRYLVEFIEIYSASDDASSCGQCALCPSLSYEVANAPVDISQL